MNIAESKSGNLQMSQRWVKIRVRIEVFRVFYIDN